jgi:RNA polymerase sigma-70 factor, ECF subfamily
MDLTAWVRDYWEPVYRLLFRLCRDPHDAEDMAQETFLRAVGKQAAFKPGTNVRAWLLRIATNLFLDLCRRKKVLKIGSLEGVEDFEAAKNVVQPSVGMEGQELGEVIAAAIAALPETHRVVFLLRTEQEMEFGEIAQIIGATEATARWHLMQARRKLMAQLEGRI